MNDKIKILFVTDGLGNGGKERQLIEIIRHLDKSRYLICLLTFNNNQRYTETAKKLTDSFYFVDKSKSKLDPLFYIFEIFEKLKPDIIHVFDLLSMIYTYIPSLFYKKRIINASIQDTYADSGYQRTIKEYFLNKSGIIIANSKTGLEAYGVKGEVLYNIIDPGRFMKRKNTDKFSAVMVANFTKYKDYHHYLELVNHLLGKNIIDIAYAVGEGQFIEKYKKLVNGYSQDVKNKIIFTGKIRNIEEFLCDKNIGVLFSTEKYGEGISNSVLEYMAAGLIPIVSDIGASREIINNRENGYLVNKEDKEAISSIINELKNNSELYSSLQTNAISSVRSKFDVRSNMKLLEECYEKILDADK